MASDKQDFLNLIHSTYHTLEYGMYSVLDYELKEYLEQRPDETKEWLRELYKENIDDLLVLEALLRTMGHMDPELIVEPYGKLTAIDALAHPNVTVRDCAVRCLENWECTEMLPALREVEFPEKWLQDYLIAVIRGLEKAEARRPTTI
jgi:hypothetical protein